MAAGSGQLGALMSQLMSQGAGASAAPGGVAPSSMPSASAPATPPTKSAKKPPQGKKKGK